MIHDDGHTETAIKLPASREMGSNQTAEANSNCHSHALEERDYADMAFVPLNRPQGQNCGR